MADILYSKNLKKNLDIDIEVMINQLDSKRNARIERANSNIQARADKARASSITYQEKVDKAYEDREQFKEQKLGDYWQKLEKLEKFKKLKQYEAKERQID